MFLQYTHKIPPGDSQHYSTTICTPKMGQFSKNVQFSENKNLHKILKSKKFPVFMLKILKVVSMNLFISVIFESKD